MKLVPYLSLLATLAVTSAVLAQTPPPAEPEAEVIFAAAPGDPVLFEELRGVRIVAREDQLPAPGFPDDGIDVTLVPEFDVDTLATVVAAFINQPASQASLDRLTHALRTALRLTGRPFVTVYLPPQDVTDGYVQVVASEARSDGDVLVIGARHFAQSSYQAQLRQRDGAPIDARQLADDVAWLNRNPYRRAAVSAQAGETPGTTRLVLRADERLPLSANANYSNSGTKVTGEHRVSGGFTWGNAFGRGDLLTVGVSADPDWDHLRSYNAGYTAFLPWRHVLSLQGAYSTVESVMPEPFAQRGKSWQAGARYEVPLPALRNGRTQNLNVSADFKYSDNTLEFAAIPVTDNVTHIVQLGATYGLNFPAFGGQNDVRVEAVGSPGGLSSYNDDAAFAGSRFGAKAAYAYAKLGVRHQRRLGRWSLSLSADAQLASGALLGTEQLTGAGSAAVRGYRESSAFGDAGVIGSAELHAPGFSVFKRRDRADLFTFIDAASLQQRGDGDSLELSSAGLGVNYQFGGHISLRAAYGWQFKSLPSSRGVYTGHGHVNANISF